MGQLSKDMFVCLDCESTGLDINNDRIIELAAKKFTFEKVIDEMQFLINPEINIPEESQLIHNISNKMVADKPPIKKVLSPLLDFVGSNIIVGHGILFDIELINNEAKRVSIETTINKNIYIDTLRLARLYGECKSNSLENLRMHFNIPQEGAHRAMNDVIVNIEVFKYLTTTFNKTEELLNRLKKPIQMRKMPLGKHKGRKFSDIPSDYLAWSAGKDFDQDLLYSIRLELKNRKQKTSFLQASNPFSNL